jgi:hypothetical protein
MPTYLLSLNLGSRPNILAKRTLAKAPMPDLDADAATTTADFLQMHVHGYCARAYSVL